MKKKLIEKYNEWKEKGVISKAGLCNELTRTKYKKTLKLFNPTEEDEIILWRENKCVTFWGYDRNIDNDIKDKAYKFTNRRQIIVLFICAMHDEL